MQRISPFLEVKYGWDFGESGWNSGMDENLLKFSFLLVPNIDGIINSLPSNPQQGESYFLTTDRRLYYFLNGVWNSVTTPLWGVVRIKSTGESYTFDGFSLILQESLQDLSDSVDAINGTIASLGSAAFEDVDTFATQGALDISSAQDQIYTDNRISDLEVFLAEPTGSSALGFYREGRTVEDKLLERVSAADLGMQAGTTVTTAMQTLGDSVDGKHIYFGPGVYTMSGVLWTAKSNFVLEFHPQAVFKVADGSNTWAFRLDGCFDFLIKGRATVDGNKVNNVTGGSGPGASNGALSLSSCYDFEIESAVAESCHTIGIAIQGCTNFKAGRIEANNTARVGVSLYQNTKFDIGVICGSVSDISNIVRLQECTKFSIETIRTFGATTVGALFELGNADFYVGSTYDEGSGQGVKLEECTRFTCGSLVAKGSTVSHGVTLNNVSYYTVLSVLATDCVRDGFALLATSLQHRNGYIGAVKTYLNTEYGVQVQKSGAGSFISVRIVDLNTFSNTLSNFEIDGDVPSGVVSIGSFLGGAPGAGRWDIESATPATPSLNRPRIDKAATHTTNVTSVPTLAANATAPSVGALLNYSDIVETANTVATTVRNLAGYTGMPRTFYIFVNDAFTTFANGSGGTEGRIVVTGGSVAAAFGELWQATYRSGVMYLHKVA